MKVRVVTTITTLIDVDTFEPDHEVSIHSDDAIPEALARAAAVGGCKSLLRQLGEDE